MPAHHIVHAPVERIAGAPHFSRAGDEGILPAHLGERLAGAISWHGPGKRPRKARRQNTVATGRDTVKEVDPASGLPVEPKDVANGYGNQLACIL